METVFTRVDGLIIESHRLKLNGQIAEHITRLIWFVSIKQI